MVHIPSDEDILKQLAELRIDNPDIGMNKAVTIIKQKNPDWGLSAKVCIQSPRSKAHCSFLLIQPILACPESFQGRRTTATPRIAGGGRVAQQ